MKFFIYIILVICLVGSIKAQIELSEIMINPLDGNEWIEFYVFENFNMQNLSLQDNLQTDEIVCCNNHNCNFTLVKDSYFLLFDQDTSMNLTSNYFCVDDNSIGNGLGNSNDKILLRQDSQLLLNFSYSNPTSKGMTISVIDGGLVETKATPWSQNIISNFDFVNDVDINLISLIDDNIFTQSEYKLFRIENLNYPLFNEQINISFYYNISFNGNIISEEIIYPTFKSYTTTKTGIFYSEIPGLYTICGDILESSINDNNIFNNNYCMNITVINSSSNSCNISFRVVLDDKIVNNGEKVYFDFELDNNEYAFEIEYYISDLYGNILKNKVITKNTNKKSFTPNIKELDRIYILNSKLLNIACNNTFENQTLKNTILIKGNQNQEEIISELSNELSIELVRPPLSNSYKFGEFVNIKLDVIKGNSKKSSIKLKVKNSRIISEEISLNVYGQNMHSSFVVPIKLKDNCDAKFKEGSYELIVEGLDNEIKKTIVVENNFDNCKIETKKSNNIEYLLIYYPNQTIQYKDNFLIFKIENSDEIQHNYSIWSYLYLGFASYSGEREKNKFQIKLNPNEIMYVKLQNKLEKQPNKDIKLKIKILKDDRVTPFEITKDIWFLNVTYSQDIPKKIFLEESLQTVNSTSSIKNKTNKITGKVVYESTNVKLKNNLLYFVILIVLLGIFSLIKIKRGS